MATIELINTRRNSDLNFILTLTDNGVSVSWDSVEIQQLFMYSERQRGFSGRCSYKIDTDDPHLLKVKYPYNGQRFLGIHRVVIQVVLAGGHHTYDARVCNMVASTADESIEYDEVLDVPITVSEVDTTIMHEILAACQEATADASKAAEAAQQAVDTLRGGLAGQVLSKNSDKPFDFNWKTAEEIPLEQEEGERTNAAMSQKAVTDSLNGIRHPFLSLERFREYLYRVTFDSLPEERADNSPVQGACSAYVKDGRLHRNYDFNYDRAASFIVRTGGFEGMSMITGLDDGQMDDELIAQLPYRMVDGRNNHGIMMSVHLLFNDWHYTGAGQKSIPLTRLPYEILSRVKTMATISTDLADVLGNLSVTEAMGDYLLQILVTDGTTTYAVIPPTTDGQNYVLVDATANPKMSNFRWVAAAQVERTDADLQTRPTGVERYNMMPCDLADLRFTKAYETPDRLSEFIGIDDTTKASTDAELEAIYDDARAEYLDRRRDGKTWQTMHSVVYGDKMEHLYIQEDWSDDIVASGVSKEYVDGKLTELEQEVGDLDELDTESKDNLVGAINEVYNHGGILTVSAYDSVEYEDIVECKYAMIMVINGNTPYGRIIPISEYFSNMLCEFEYEWFIVKDNLVEFFNEAQEPTYSDLLSWMENHSAWIVTDDLIGALSGLETTDKSNLVAAVNEVNSAKEGKNIIDSDTETTAVSEALVVGKTYKYMPSAGVATLAFTLTPPTETDVVRFWRFKFKSGATATEFTPPSGLYWSGGQQLLPEANTIYEVMIDEDYCVSVLSFKQASV